MTLTTTKTRGGSSSQGAIEAPLPQLSAAEGDVYFEVQQEAWCGMHALNNFRGGPFVSKDDCIAAARQVVADLSQVAEGDQEDFARHLDRSTGWLSIDVINRLGAANLNVHVDGASVLWEDLQQEEHAAALVNWNNAHWTVLRAGGGLGAWTHMNSVLGDELCDGLRTRLDPSDVQRLLREIAAQRGGVSLHRITPALMEASHLHEPEGMRAMLPPDAAAAAERAGQANQAGAARAEAHEAAQEAAEEMSARMEELAAAEQAALARAAGAEDRAGAAEQALVDARV